MMCTRYTAAATMLLALALVPTVMHSYMDGRQRDGFSAQAIPSVLAGQPGAPTKRRAGWGQDRLASDDWFERQYPGGVTLFVGRSFDAKKLYHHPELAVAYGRSYEAAAVRHLPSRPDVPVHVLRGAETDSKHAALYVLAYDGRYVSDPIRFQLRNSLEQVFSARRPMTLFFASQELPSADASVESSGAARVLLAAVQEFERQSERSAVRP